MTSGCFELRYLYRDAGNYKFRSSVIVDGYFDFEAVRSFLIDGEFFIPEIIGLANLCPISRNLDDHDFHEFEEITQSRKVATTVSVKLLMSKLMIANKKDWRR